MAFVQLTDEEISELLAPFKVQSTPAIADALSHHVEAAVRTFVFFLDEPDPDWSRQLLVDYTAELKRIGADPARALAVIPTSDGGRHARRIIDLQAASEGIDAETRSGTVAIGDLALAILGQKVARRADEHFRWAEDVLFERLCQAIRVLAPAALETLPSNETVDIDRGPAVGFASAFIQIIIDRVIDRLPGASDRTRNRLAAILNKTDRRLLDGIRKVRQFWLINGGLGRGRATARFARFSISNFLTFVSLFDPRNRAFPRFGLNA